MAYGGDTGDGSAAEKISYAVWRNVHFLCKAVMAPASDAAEFFNTFQLKTHCSHIRRDILRGSSASASCRAVIFVLCIIVSHSYKKHQAEIECMIYARNSVQMNKNYLMRRNIQLESADERIFKRFFFGRVGAVAKEAVWVCFKEFTQAFQFNVSHQTFAELDPQNGQLGKIVAIDLQSGGQFILSQLSSHPQLADPAANDIFLLTGGYLSHKNS
jgi:hypothetical protein